MPKEPAALGVRAHVTVQLEIVAHSHWGAECSLDQVYKQAADDVDGVIRRIKDKVPDTGIASAKLVKIDAIVATRT